MSAEDGWRPTPAMMPRRRPAIPPAQRPPATSRFQAAAGFPRRGLRRAIAWPDTGVLLGLGTDPDLLDRFRQVYRGRIRLARRVARELRQHSEESLTPGSHDHDYDRVAAATRVVQALLVGSGRLELSELRDEDLADVAKVAEQLKALSDVGGKSHGGEAEIIVLAMRAAEDTRAHVLLTNDGGASVIAHKYRIPARHIGDIIAEFACADPTLGPDACLAAFNAAVLVSAPPAHCRPREVSRFVCGADASQCALCDEASEYS